MVHSSNHTPRPGRIAIIGAGIAGAVAAYELRQHGHAVTVFEKESQIGGRIQTLHHDGFVINEGASIFAGNLCPLLMGYLERLGLTGAIVPLARAVYFANADGRLLRAPASLRDIFTLRGVPLHAKWGFVRSVLGWSLRRRALSLSDPAQLARFDNQSLAAYGESRLGATAARYLLHAPLEACWFFDPAAVSAAIASVLEAHLIGMRLFTLRDGMATLVQALLHDADVRTGQPVNGLLLDSAGRVRVTTPAADAQTYDAVIVACPAPAAAQIAATLPPDCLTPFQRRFLCDQHYLSHLNITLLLTEDSAERTIIPTAPGAGIASLGIASNGGRAIATIYAREWLTRELADQPPGAVAATAWAHAKQLCTDLPSWCEVVTLARYAAAIPLHPPGRYAEIVDFLAEQRHPIYFAGDYLATATMEGAIGSGVRAARAVLNALY